MIVEPMIRIATLSPEASVCVGPVARVVGVALSIRMSDQTPVALIETK